MIISLKSLFVYPSADKIQYLSGEISRLRFFGKADGELLQPQDLRGNGDGGLRLQLFRRGKQAFSFPIRIEPNRARRRTEHRRQGV